MKAFRVTALFAVFLVLTTFSVAASGSTEATSGPTHLTMWNYWDGQNGEALKSLIDEYQKANPGVTIENVFIGWGDLLTKLQTAAQSNSGPDLAAVDMVWMPTLVETGRIVPIDGYMSSSNVAATSFYPELLKPGNHGGHQLSLPVSTNNLELFYNKDLFRKAGLDPNKPPQTWQELIDYAKKMTATDGSQWGMELYTQTGEGLTWQAQVYIWQEGGDFLGADGKSVAFNGPNSQKAISFLQDLIQKYKVAPLANWGLFGQGKAAMTVDGSWMVSGYASSAPFDWGTARVPVPADGRPATNMGGEQAFIMQSNQTQQNAAWNFLKWFVSTGTQVSWDMKTGFMPNSASVASDPGYLSWVDKTEPRLKAFVDNQKYAHARPSVAEYPQISDIFSQEVEKAFHNTTDVKSALDTAAQRVAQLIE